MSRLIVKGLPKRYDEALLRKLFSCGSDSDITDAKVMRTADGRSRQFAFVGFRTKDAAQRARQLLDRTYVDTAQVSVELARPIGDSAIPRPWSKYSRGSSAHDGATPSENGISRSPVPPETEKRRKDGTAKRSASGVARAEQVADHGGKSSAEAESASKREPEAGDETNDASFAEFRDAVSKRAQKPLWSDSGVLRNASVKKMLVESRKTGGKGRMLERSHVVFDEDDDDEEDELYEELTVQQPGHAEQTSSREDEQGDDAQTRNAQDAPSGGVRAADDDTLDDMAYFRSKIWQNLDEEPASRDENGEGESEVVSDLEEGSNGTDEDEGEAHVSTADKPPENDIPKDGVARHTSETPDNGADVHVTVDASETGRLFVRNLAFSVTVDDLETLFEPFGTIADIHLVHDPRTKQSRGVAFVLYVVPENAVAAMQALDNTVFCGRLLHVLPGKPRPQPKVLVSKEVKAPGSNAFKEDREAARRESARTGADATAYNAMFMSTDAVANVMSDRLGVGKGELYGTSYGDAGSAAVRIAAGEARLQAETRQYFLSNGIDLEIAQKSSRAPRRRKLSRSAFLVKNLPARISGMELMGIFKKYGRLELVLVAPAGLLGVVGYELANDAKKAYNALAYTRLKDTPLYLEWLPVEAIVGRAEASLSKNALRSVTREVKDGAGELTIDRGTDAAGADAAHDSVPQASVFVKNLNFDTRDEALRKHILKALRRQPKLISSLRSAMVATRKNEKDPSGPRLSYGYGFLEFASENDAKEAVKLAQGSVLDGHTLELRIANRSSQAAGASRSKKRSKSSDMPGKPSAKLMVRNIAFEATSKDVRYLFASFGQVRSIRVPRKQDGTHRGFGFVEFVSKNEAKAARDALAASHLYGRRLVIDYAYETEDGFGSLEELQARAARQVVKRRRIDGGIDGSGAEASGDVQDDDTQMMMDEMFS